MSVTDEKQIDDHDEDGESVSKETQVVESRAGRKEDGGRVLVPSSMELGASGADHFLISRQIARMEEPGRMSPEDLEEKRIVFPESSNRAMVQKFRELRTRLLEVSSGENFSLVVTSLAEGGGASFVALNLAAAFAFDSSKTALVIDCNLRDPSLHDWLDLMPEVGLTDFLEDPELDISRVIYPTGIRRLRLVPAGSRRESASEFFTSFRMRQFLHALRKRYPDRFIILDAPSLESSPDARILSELCDYTMLVVPHARVSEEDITKSVAQINKDKFIGVVMNG